LRCREGFFDNNTRLSRKLRAALPLSPDAELIDGREVGATEDMLCDMSGVLDEFQFEDVRMMKRMEQLR
jgi:hypothetical protein